MKKRDEFVFKIHGDPSRWHVTVCYALLRSVKVYCDSHVLPRSPKIWCPIVTSVAKFLTVKNFATLVTINTIHSRPLAITTIPVYVLSRLPRFFPIVVIVAIMAQCKPSIIVVMPSDGLLGYITSPTFSLTISRLWYLFEMDLVNQPRRVIEPTHVVPIRPCHDSYSSLQCSHRHRPPSPSPSLLSDRMPMTDHLIEFQFRRVAAISCKSV